MDEQQFQIEINQIGNGYLARVSKCAGYQRAYSPQTYYQSITLIEQDLPALFKQAQELEITESTDQDF